MSQADAQAIECHTVSVIVDHEAGVLARVVGLFSGRGYNIESLTVSAIDEKQKTARITIVTSGTPMIINQIKALLGKLVPVHRVVHLTGVAPFVSRELLMVHLSARGAARREALRIADIFKATVADTTLGSFVFVLTGTTGKIDAFVALMRALGELDIARSGVVALARGAGETDFLPHDKQS